MNGDGILAVYVPNFTYLRIKDTGPLAFMRRRQWSDLHPQEHVHQYTPTTLRAMLEQAGFDTLHFDIGHPFLHGRWWKAALKRAAYGGVCALKAATGIHLGGLEVIARYRNPRVRGTTGTSQTASGRNPHSGTAARHPSVHSGTGIPAGHALARHSPERAAR